jgi:hypothetical protein
MVSVAEPRNESPLGSNTAPPISVPESGESARSRSGVMVINVSSSKAPAGIVSVMPPAWIEPPAAPIVEPATWGRSRTGVATPSSVGGA